MASPKYPHGHSFVAFLSKCGPVTLHARKPASSAYPKELKTLGDHLRKRRLELGLLQADVAKKFGASTASVVNWEKNKAEPELHFLPAIHELLGYVPERRTKTIAERLVAFRRARGWSQKRLADELNVDPTTLSRWELGKKAPWGEFAEKVERELRGD